MNYTIEEKEEWIYIRNQNGKDLGYAKSSGIGIIEVDGYAFKDLNKNGQLDPYEDWRLPIEDRIKDLAARMTIEQIAGMMLYSSHQSLSSKGGKFAEIFGGTYNGKKFSEYDGQISDLTDQQKAFLNDHQIRHFLLTTVDSPEVSAQWSNNVQAAAERIDLGIPVNISSDPRHGTNADAEFNAGAGGDISKWPEQLGLAATFDPEIVKNFGEIASREYRALGITTALSPQIDLATEPRWMRFSGTFGEGVKLVAELAQAYCDGYQTTIESDDGWGERSVNTMTKHWPGGGSGEAGRDAHYGYGKYAVYPGNAFDTHLKPFTEGAFKLKGKTKRTAAVMPYYTISFDQDKTDHENVGNGFSKYIITDLLRGKYRYDGVVCTDWSITADAPQLDSFIGGKSWGVEDRTVAERHYMALKAGVDQFGGNNDIKPVIKAYELGVKEYGEAYMKERFQASAKRLLRNLFQVGLFENPYLETMKSNDIVGNPEFMEKGYEAQLKSIVLLKNKNRFLPIQSRKKVYIPERTIGKTRDWFGNETPEHKELPVNLSLVEKYFDVTTDPEEADFAFVVIASPQSTGFSAEKRSESENNGYLPISLQYGPYKAVHAREEALAGKDRSYKDKESIVTNDKDLAIILELKDSYPDLPIVVSIKTKNPTILSELEPFAEAIMLDFGVQTQALLEITVGQFEPQGLLPFQMPKDMVTVELQKEDVPLDMDCYQDEEGHVYDFGFGLNFQGKIDDHRTNYFKSGNRVY